MSKDFSEILAKALLVFWLCASFALIYMCIYKGKKQKKMLSKSLWYSIGISHLISPTFIGVYVTAIPIPASYSIYAFTLSLFFGDIWVFHRNDAKIGLPLATISLIVCFLIVWGIATIIIKLAIKDITVKNYRVKDRRNRTMPFN